MMTRIAILLVIAVAIGLSPGARAVRPTNEPPRNARPAYVNAVRSGTITSVDVARNRIVIDRAAYMFSPTTVAIHASGFASQANPLNLARGSRIRFAVQPESVANKERVTEIWLLEPPGKAGQKR